MLPPIFFSFSSGTSPQLSDWIVALFCCDEETIFGSVIALQQLVLGPTFTTSQSGL